MGHNLAQILYAEIGSNAVDVVNFHRAGILAVMDRPRDTMRQIRQVAYRHDAVARSGDVPSRTANFVCATLSPHKYPCVRVVAQSAP